jgi:hypothetical protein
MTVHLLGICRSGAAAGLPARLEPGESGIQVRWLSEGPLAAATVPPQPATKGPLLHARLLAAIHRRVSVLPARYGAAVPNEAAVRDFLARRREDFAAALDAVDGADEYGVRIELDDRERETATDGSGAAPAMHGGPATSPREYLAARRAQYARRDQCRSEAERVVDACVGGVGHLARTWRQLAAERVPQPCPTGGAFLSGAKGVPPGPRAVPCATGSASALGALQSRSVAAGNGCVRLAFLVQRDGSAAFLARLHELMTRTACGRWTLVGPWPPYSFSLGEWSAPRGTGSRAAQGVRDPRAPDGQTSSAASTRPAGGPIEVLPEHLNSFGNA